ncbi:hypothetical protein RB597_008589 [Gaeumannomyces tritici]
MAFLLGASPRRARLLVLATVLVLTTLYLVFHIKQDVGAPFGRGLAGSTGPQTTNKGAEEDLGVPKVPAAAVSNPDPVTPVPAPAAPAPTCLKFEELQRQKPGPASAGKRKFPLVRPPPGCRTYNLSSLEALLVRMKTVIKDPDLYRLFENSYPNTLDTMIKWRGFAREQLGTEGAAAGFGGQSSPALGPETDEELTYVITGDIDAMWLRDSASQIYSYLPLLEADKAHDSLAGLWRGLINLQARYITISPYCHSFQPPPESGIRPTHNGAFHQNNPQPPYDPVLVFDCKWELDSLASFLRVSAAYAQRTGDLSLFGKYKWKAAVRAAVDASAAMQLGTYADDGKVQKSAWTFTGWTNRGSETLTNDGLGNPSRRDGMVRTAFRPSDDATIFQFLVPANVMFGAALEDAAPIADQLPGADSKALAADMRSLAKEIFAGFEADAVVPHRDFGDVIAYEVDGFGGANLMDDANVPSLLSIPLFFNSSASVAGAAKSNSPFRVQPRDEKNGTRKRSKHQQQQQQQQQQKTETRDYAQIYRNTRKFVLSDANPYFAKGPVISAVGGPHLGPGRAWPMAALVAGLTAYEPLSGDRTPAEVRDEVAEQLKMVLDSTAGSGVVHESVNSWDEHVWTRSWFGWANGLFGELILRIEEQDKGGANGLLSRSWQ